MADFKQAWARTSKTEGGYVNRSDDPGKETYRGITIRDWGEWQGWPIVHHTIAFLGYKSTVDCPPGVRQRIDAALAVIPELAEMVSAFYKKHFWDPLKLDAEESQLIAEEVFDTAVNMGVETARKMIKEAKGA